METLCVCVCVCVCVCGASNRETEGQQGKEMQLNAYDAFLSSVKKRQKTNTRLVLIL